MLTEEFVEMKIKDQNWCLILLIYFILCTKTKAKVKRNKMSEEIKEAGEICQENDSGKLIRIVGGDYAPQNAFPWMAAVYEQDKGKKSGEMKLLTSAGSIISKNYVITCAHSLYGKKEKDFFVRLGDYNLLSSADDVMRGIIKRKVAKIYIHEKFNMSGDDDIALIRLNASVKFTQFIRPICVSGLNVPARKLKKNDKVMAAGWGKTKAELTRRVTTPNADLRFVVLKVFDLGFCQSKLSDFSRNKKKWICAGSWGKETKDTCNGDSGGPLMPFRDQESPEPILVGITSHGDFECKGIGFYTNVTNYAKWIGQKAK